MFGEWTHYLVFAFSGRLNKEAAKWETAAGGLAEEELLRGQPTWRMTSVNLLYLVKRLCPWSVK